MRKEVVIIGGGASGLAAGVLLSREGFRVTILEKTETCGKKLSMTGNGRCNLSNQKMSASCFCEQARPLAEKLLERFGVDETIRFFSSVGVLVRPERGMLYPVSGLAQTVTDALMDSFLCAGGRVLYRRQAKEILQGTEENAHPLTVRTAGEVFPADAVIIASGGMSGPKNTKSTGDGYYIAKTCGAEVTEVFPSLCGLLTDDVSLPEGTGVRVHGALRLLVDDKETASEEGEVQMTNGRLSGIPVMQMSAECAHALRAERRVTLFLDLFPEADAAKTEEMMEERIRAMRDASPEGTQPRTLGSFLNGFAHPAINGMLLGHSGYGADTLLSQLPDNRLKELMRCGHSIPFRITGTDSFAHAQATSGGIALSSLTDELELRGAPGVFCTGEVVDVDGRCGGYNLQWAWTSAFTVAEALTK